MRPVKRAFGKFGGCDFHSKEKREAMREDFRFSLPSVDALRRGVLRRQRSGFTNALHRFARFGETLPRVGLAHPDFLFQKVILICNDSGAKSKPLRF